MAVDFEALANSGMSADQLANIFLQEYSADKEVSYPINPFQILTNLGIPFVLRPFKKYEGIYIPAAGEGDFPIVGINLNRPITRQRYTAAHELCHHLKDVRSGFMCAINAKSEIEKYAEAFKRVESPFAGKVWIEIDRTTYIELLDTSPSAKKVWIEIIR